MAYRINLTTGEIYDPEDKPNLIVLLGPDEDEDEDSEE